LLPSHLRDRFIGRTLVPLPFPALDDLTSARLVAPPSRFPFSLFFCFLPFALSFGLPSRSSSVPTPDLSPPTSPMIEQSAQGCAVALLQMTSHTRSPFLFFCGACRPPVAPHTLPGDSPAQTPPPGHPRCFSGDAIITVRSLHRPLTFAFPLLFRSSLLIAHASSLKSASFQPPRTPHPFPNPKVLVTDLLVDGFLLAAVFCSRNDLSSTKSMLNIETGHVARGVPFFSQPPSCV